MTIFDVFCFGFGCGFIVAIIYAWWEVRSQFRKFFQECDAFQKKLDYKSKF